MTNRTDNDCLSAAERWLDLHAETRSAATAAEALIAFALLVVGLYVALHIGPVL